MPHHKQFKKSLKQNEKARLKNHAVKSRVAKIVKKVTTAKTKEEAQAVFSTAVSLIDSTAHKGIIKKQTAARKKSRLSKLIARMP
ncbi:30S ribosomal protein S20 [bacterium]|nr:30S ribosomal protein S20 [bacterium]